jgi:glyoxylase-like metal-dependent hydrolase (beta-lactamase superfamily II)
MRYSMRYIRPDLVGIRGWFVSTHLLLGDDELVLVDTGLFGDFKRIQRAVAALGRHPSDLKAILLTHGHLDHTANAARLREWSGAKLYAPAGDELHVQGRYRYSGVARVCGWLEGVGRGLVGYRAPEVDVWVRGGDELPFWGGLRVIALPGHTPGHVGFLSKTKRLAFVGDAFAMSWRVALPPPIFNTDTLQVRQSFLDVAGADVDFLVPAHYFRLDETVVDRVRNKALRLSR